MPRERLLRAAKRIASLAEMVLIRNDSSNA